MILGDREIWMEIESNRLVFEPPVQPVQLATSALDLRLSNEFTTFPLVPEGVTVEIDTSKIGNVESVIARYGERQIIPTGESFLLRPGDFVLAYTLEYIQLPNYLAARVEGRSALARLGISIHQTAPTVHAAFEGQLRLEISHNGPFPCRLYPGQRVCQLVLERLGSPAQNGLGSLFQRQRQNQG